MGEAVEVVVAGGLCLDLIPHMAHIPAAALALPGRTFEIPGSELATGGAVPNTGLALHCLGVRVALMSSVGDDVVGRVLLELLRAHDPTFEQYIRVIPGLPSAHTYVLSPQQADRSFLPCIGANAVFGPADIDFSVVGRAKIFHLGYPPYLLRLAANGGAELLETYRRAKAAGAVTSMDMAMPDPQGVSAQADWSGLLRRVLPEVDVFVPSIGEIVYMLRRADFDAWGGEILAHVTAGYLADLAAELLDMGAAIAGFKLGERGLYLQAADSVRLARLERLPLDLGRWANTRAWHPAFQVNVIGTTGAGDAAYAGLLGALLRGLSPQETARFACAVGACCVEAADATTGLKTWAETQARIDAGWPVRAVRLPGIEPFFNA